MKGEGFRIGLISVGVSKNGKNEWSPENGTEQYCSASDLRGEYDLRVARHLCCEVAHGAVRKLRRLTLNPILYEVRGSSKITSGFVQLLILM